MTDVLARVVALKTTPISELKQLWRDLFDTEPPAYNRRFLENRLAYRLQELAHGGLIMKICTGIRVPNSKPERKPPMAVFIPRSRPAKLLPMLPPGLLR